MTNIMKIFIYFSWDIYLVFANQWYNRDGHNILMT